MRVYTVYAKWDDEAKVWYVEQSDIPGLATEAPTAEQFVKHVRELAPDLVELNAADGKQFPIELMWTGTQRFCLGY